MQHSAPWHTVCGTTGASLPDTHRRSAIPKASKSSATYALAAWLAIATPASAACPTNLLPVRILLKHAWTVVLARVVESTFPGPLPPPWEMKVEEQRRRVWSATGKILVLKTWRGPFAPGSYVRFAQPALFAGCCLMTSLPIGDEFVFFASLDMEPISASEGAVIELSQATCVMKELDEMVAKGTLALKPD
jgi:hypothetical protein